jgi:diketogulonate reductase-like aldo/keto reductase
VEAAIAAGYRHIDTAYSYCNEVEISKALRSKMQQGIIQRQDMYVVSKVGAAAECLCGLAVTVPGGNELAL